MMTLLLESAGRLVGWLFVQAPLVLLAAAVTTWVLRDASAATRHRVWSAAAVTVLVLPLLGLMVPRVEVGLPSPVERLLRPEMGVALTPAAVPAPVVFRYEPARARVPAPTVVRLPAAVRASSSPPGISERIRPDARGLGSAFVHRPAGRADALASMPVPPAMLAGLLWAVVAAGLMVRLLVSVVRTRREEARLAPAPAGIASVAHAVARSHGVWNLRVLIGDADAMPSTWGARRPVLLLPSSVATWPTAHLETVVRHELAHVRRADTRLQFLADLVCALHWFDPLAWYAAHRMRVERELACDDEVLAGGACPSDYAGQLVSLARTLRPAPAGVAMAGTGGLRTRIESLLDARRPRGTSSGVSTAIRLVAAIVALGVAALAPGASAAQPYADGISVAPVVPINPPRIVVAVPSIEVAAHAVAHVPRQTGTLCWSDTRGGSTSTRTNNDQFRLDWERDDCTVDIQVEGELRFNADFTGIAGISDGGRAVFEERDGPRSRRAELRPSGAGLERRWLVDGRETAWNDDATRWLEAMLLNTFRTGGMAAERAEWLVNERGIDALLQELPLLRGDWARGQYYRAAFGAELSEDQVARLTRQAAADIDSDHTLQTVLEVVAERHSLANPSIRAAYIDAAASIDSDHSRGQALDAALAQPDLPDADLAAILEAVAGIDSDHEKMTLLIALAERHPLDSGLRAAYLNAVRSIDSDHAAGRAAEALFERQSPTGDEVALALEIASGIDSDHEVSQLLMHMPVDLRDDAQRHAFEAAIAQVDSDHALGEVLRSLLADGAVDEVTAGVVLRGSAGIGSDHELGEVLIDLVEAGGVTSGNRVAFEQAMESIGSRHTRERVQTALGTR